MTDLMDELRAWIESSRFKPNPWEDDDYQNGKIDGRIDTLDDLEEFLDRHEKEDD